MRRNSKRKLRMLPSDATSSSSSTLIFAHQLRSCSEDHNRIKIFYSDATELQAIFILWLARKEMEENSKSVNYVQFQVQGNRGLSLKKSLQKFLQRRKDRLQDQCHTNIN